MSMIVSFYAWGTLRQVKTAIEFAGVQLAYGRTVVLDDVDLVLPAATLTTLIGPNGSGKSTLLSAIAGLLRPTSGRITVDGVVPDRHHPRASYVLQTTTSDALLPLTVAETVRMGRYPNVGLFRRMSTADRDAVDDAMGRMDITNLAGRQLRELSGGQRQRALVAQGLVQEAPVLLLDEPVTGLDILSQQLISRAMDAEVAAGRTVVVSTHDLADAARGDTTVLLSGRVVAAGPPAEVLTPDNLRSTYGHQLVTIDSGQALLDDSHHHDHVEGDGADQAAQAVQRP